LAGATNLVCYARLGACDDENSRRGYSVSVWVALARNATDLGPLATEGKWEKLDPRQPSVVWTDYRSDLISAIRRR
ncbi:MAG: hypothetical protein ACAI25_20795, partial [Planctomycetota bacterium]